MLRAQFWDFIEANERKRLVLSLFSHRRGRRMKYSGSDGKIMVSFGSSFLQIRFKLTPFMFLIVVCKSLGGKWFGSYTTLQFYRQWSSLMWLNCELCHVLIFVTFSILLHLICSTNSRELNIRSTLNPKQSCNNTFTVSYFTLSILYFHFDATENRIWN